MGIFKKKKHDTTDTRTRGMRITETFILPIYGPAQIGDSTKPIRPVNDEEAAREADMQERLERKVAADGTAYFVEREN
jgi:hypothetical protein